MKRNVINNFFSKWGESVKSVQHSSLKPIPKIYHDTKLFSMQSPFYIVMNYIQRDLFTDGTRELVLILSSGPTNEKCYAHLVGIWATIQVFCGAFILLDPKDGWARTDDDQNLYKNSISCVINDECEGPVIFPHLLIKVSSIGSYRSCPRAVYFREISTFKDPTFNSLYGRIATTLIQRYIHSHCNGEEITASSISDELVRDNLVSTYQIDKLDIPKEIASHSIKTVNDMYMQISKLSEYIDEPHSVLMTIPRFDSLFRTSKAFPGHGCTNSFLNTSIWSFHNGIHGCLSCIVEINDNENIHYVPVEVISTVGGTLQTDLKNGHVLSLTAQTQLIGERYGKEHSSYAFIWYLGSKQRFWVRPRKEERQHLRILRNLIATSIVKNEAPFVQSMNTSECSYCVSQVTCALYKRMEDKREFVKKLNPILPKNLCDFSTNQSRVFFQKFHKYINLSSLSMMWCCIQITSINVNERIKAGNAINDLKIINIKCINDPTNQLSEVSHIKFQAKFPGIFYLAKCNLYDNVIITKDGNMPIIGIGTITKIKDDYLKISSFEQFFKVGHVFTLDFCRTNQWSSFDTSLLTNILTKPSYSMLNTLIIDEERPIFSYKEPKFNKIGLNKYQIEAVRLSLKTLNYLLINAPHGTGRIITTLHIIHEKLKEDKDSVILVSPYFYDTLNKICNGLEQLNIPYLVNGKMNKIDERFHQRHENNIFLNAKTLPDIKFILDSIRVFVINSITKPFDIIYQQKFNLIILLEASNLPLLRSISSLSSGSPFILFGDLILDNEVESIFSHLNRIGHHAIIHLKEVYDCEPIIVSLARTIWGSELQCYSQHAIVDLNPLKVLNHKIRNFFKEIMTMDKPVIFININLFSSVLMVAIIAGILFEKVDLVSTKELLVPFCSILYICRNNGNKIFTKFNSFMETASKRINAYNYRAMKANRKDVVIATTDSYDSDILKYALGLTKRKLILMGNLSILQKSPLWVTIINQIPNEWVVSFPDEYVLNNFDPFKSMQTIFENYKLLFSETQNQQQGFDIEDLEA